MRRSGASTGSAERQSKTSSTAPHRECQPACISAQELRDYCYCPIYYRFKHVVGVGIKRSVEYNEECLTRISHFIMHGMSDGSIPNKGMVKNAYGRLLMSMTGGRKKLPVAASVVMSGMEQALAMQEFFKKWDCRPLVINHPYEITVGDATVTGHIDGIVEDKEEYHAVKIIHGHKGDDMWQNDIEVPLVMLAVRKVLLRPLAGLTVYYTGSGTSEKADTAGHDYQQAIRILDAVIRSIRGEIYYPSRLRQCRSCQYYKWCSEGKWLA